MEPLEPRRLLSQAFALDTSFGTGGMAAGYMAWSAQSDGSVIAVSDAGKHVLLHPDGSFASNYSGTLPPFPQPSFVLSNGKYLAWSSGLLTRFLPNGAIDRTFATNGSVPSFLKGTGADSFNFPRLLLNKDQIYVIGIADFNDGQGDELSDIAVEHITTNGQIDYSFGYHGLATDGGFVPAKDYSFFHATDWLGGPDGRIYVAYTLDDAAALLQFDQRGNWLQTMSLGDVMGGMRFTQNGKLMVLTGGNEYLNLALFDTGHLPTASIYAADQFSFGLPDRSGRANSASMLTRDDGELIVSGEFSNLINEPGADSFGNENFIFAVKAAPKAGTAAISGRVYNDFNSNGKLESGEPGLAYWQIYADLNNNGVFDAGEPTAFTNAIGEYTLNDLSSGNVIIREVRQNGWIRTQPAGPWPAGFYKVTLSANQQKSGLNFGNSNADHRTASISGVVFNDLNKNQVQDKTEKGLAGWQVYADTNDNGVYDIGEPVAVTDSLGRFTISGLAQGGYRIREVRKSGWTRTQPLGDWPLGYYDVVLLPAISRSGFAFGDVL